MQLKVTYKIARILFFLLCFWQLSPVFANDDSEQLFARGNDLFAKSRYKEAADTWLKIIQAGHRSASLYYNLGNAFYRTGDIPSALLYYEKAHKLDPGDEDIIFNIQVANLRTTDKMEAVPEFFIFRWWRGFILLFSLNTLAVLSIIFFILGCSSLIFYLFAGSVSLKKATFFPGVFLLLFAFTTLFMANRQAHYFSLQREAIIFSGSVTAKSEPHDVSKAVFVIHSGSKVDITGKEGDWMRIRLPNGNSGWIRSSAVREI